MFLFNSRHCLIIQRLEWQRISSLQLIDPSCQFVITVSGLVPYYVHAIRVIIIFLESYFLPTGTVHGAFHLTLGVHQLCQRQECCIMRCCGSVHLWFCLLFPHVRMWTANTSYILFLGRCSDAIWDMLLQHLLEGGNVEESNNNFNLRNKFFYSKQMMMLAAMWVGAGRVFKGRPTGAPKPNTAYRAAVDITYAHKRYA